MPILDTDTEYRETTIRKVEPATDGWSITDADGWSFWVKAKNGVVPHVGDTARFYGRGIGSMVRGLTINGAVVYYRTPDEERAHQDEQQRISIARQISDFEAKRADYDARVAALPDPFCQRIERFRAVRGYEWRWAHEGYELFTCEEAVKIATHAGDAANVDRFHKLPWDEQKAELPGLDDGHSGNTFGAACRLAWLWLSEPALVVKEHGALCPLVGCKEYGCWATTKEENDATR